MNNLFDVVIIGAGPGGMSASLYTSRANLSTLLIEKEAPGGKMLKTKIIENYPGYKDTDPIKLASDMFMQTLKAGTKYKQGNVVSIKDNETYKQVILDNGEEINAYAIILAIGGRISNNQFKYNNYLNRGLSYCAICDGSFYKDKVVALIGNDESIMDVEYLSNIAKKVYFINKENGVCDKSNVENFSKTVDYQLLGEEKVEYIVVNDKKIPVDGVFYVESSNNFNGFIHNIELENGFINVDKNMKTNISGIYACGDITNKSIKQVISACGDGASAALEAIKYVNKLKR